VTQASLTGSTGCCLSSRRRHGKPDARAYRYASDECGVEPAEAMLVAVHPWDTGGARRAGLTAVWVNRGSRTYPSYFLAPDLEARSLVDLAALLR
jgi:2-haloacid dehalogenase